MPEVRTVSAKALGAMVRGMGESGFEELVPWLMQTMTSEASSVDRSGAAQGTIYDSSGVLVTLSTLLQLDVDFLPHSLTLLDIYSGWNIS